MRRSSLLRSAAIAALLLGSVSAQSAPKPLHVAGGKVVPVAGEPVENGAVLVVDEQGLGDRKASCRERVCYVV